MTSHFPFHPISIIIFAFCSPTFFINYIYPFNSTALSIIITFPLGFLTVSINLIVPFHSITHLTFPFGFLTSSFSINLLVPFHSLTNLTFPFHMLHILHNLALFQSSVSFLQTSPNISDLKQSS